MSDNSQWRLLRTPMWVGRRTLQRRVFWHKIQNIILSHARWDARFGAMTLSEVLAFHSSTRSSYVARITRRRRRRFVAGICSCLFHLNVAMQLLQDYLICITVEDEDALLLGVVALVTFENGIGYTRSIWEDREASEHMERIIKCPALTEVRKSYGDRVVGTSLKCGFFMYIDTSRLEIVWKGSRSRKLEESKS